MRPLLCLLATPLQGSAAAAGLTLTAKSAALLPEGGASDVGASLCKYAADQKVRVPGNELHMHHLCPVTAVGDAGCSGPEQLAYASVTG